MHKLNKKEHSKMRNHCLYAQFYKYFFCVFFSCANIKINLTAIKNMREKLNITSKNLGIKEPGNMNITNLLDTIRRYKTKHNSYRLRRKLRRLGLNKYVKKQNVSESDLHKAIKLQKISQDDLKKIAILRRIKNINDFLKEDLIYTLLSSGKHLLEDNYVKYINNNTDDEIKARINNIRTMLTKLDNIVTKYERNIIKKDLYKIENKKRLTRAQKERIQAYLTELALTLDKSRKTQTS